MLPCLLSLPRTSQSDLGAPSSGRPEHLVDTSFTTAIDGVFACLFSPNRHLEGTRPVAYWCPIPFPTMNCITCVGSSAGIPTSLFLFEDLLAHLKECCPEFRFPPLNDLIALIVHHSVRVQTPPIPEFCCRIMDPPSLYSSHLYV